MDNNTECGGRPISSRINIFLGAGLFFVIIGAMLLIRMKVPVSAGLGIAVPFLFSLIGGSFLYRAFTRWSKSGFMFFGILLTVGGILFLLGNSGLFGSTMERLWPLLTITVSVSLFCSGFYKYRRLRPVFFVPAFMLLFLGAMFALFSFDVITEPFSVFAAHWWPAMLIAAGIGLVALFFYQRHRQAVHFETDDLDDFGDSGDMG